MKMKNLAASMILLILMPTSTSPLRDHSLYALEMEMLMV
jgi:hypothetical protein